MMGHSTYLHAGAGTQWPADHAAEDTFEAPSQPWQPAPLNVRRDHEYSAEFGTDGSARLVLNSKRHIATFDTYRDAKTAAEALNNHKGY